MSSCSSYKVYKYFFISGFNKQSHHFFFKTLSLTALLTKLRYISLFIVPSPLLQVSIFQALQFYMPFPSIVMVINSMAFDVNDLISGSSVDLNLILNLV